MITYLLYNNSNNVDRRNYKNELGKLFTSFFLSLNCNLKVTRTESAKLLIEVWITFVKIPKIVFFKIKLALLLAYAELSLFFQQNVSYLKLIFGTDIAWHFFSCSVV